MIPAGEIDPNHYYPTPLKLAQEVMNRVQKDFMIPVGQTVLDPGCGTGIWGEAYAKIDPWAEIWGIDVQDIEYNEAYDQWYKDNFLSWSVDFKFGLVIGNPPFKYAEEFVRRSLEFTKNQGLVIFLLRSAFKESAQRWYKNNQPGLFQTHCYAKEYQLVQRPGFKPNKHGRNSPEHAYSIFVWQKNNYPDLKTDWPISDWISWK